MSDVMKGMKKSVGIGLSIPLWDVAVNLSYLVNEKRFAFSFWSRDEN